jgi:hypothetical protein
MMMPFYCSYRNKNESAAPAATKWSTRATAAAAAAAAAAPAIIEQQQQLRAAI